MKRGFTVVEVLVTLVVMAILLSLGTVGLRASLANGRDAERKADIETIARGLEVYYAKGNPYFIAGTTKGAYPDTNAKIHIDGTGWCYTAYFPDQGQQDKYSTCRPGDGYWSEVFGVSDAALTPPNMTTRELWNPWMIEQATIPARIAAELDKGKYVYYPLTHNNTHCYSDAGCPKYELYYKKETNGEVVTVRSKHQQ